MSNTQPTVLLSFKVPADVLEWVDEDIHQRHAANRSVWFNTLLADLKAGRLRPAAPVVTLTQATRSVVQ